MRARLHSLLLVSALAFVPAAVASAQTAVPTKPQKATTAATPVASQPVPQAAAPAAKGTITGQPAVARQPSVEQSTVQSQAPMPTPLPPPVWTVADARQLLFAIQTVAREGLNPTDYDPAGLFTALNTGDSRLLSAAATHRFNKLSSDLALGHVRGDDRKQWFIDDPDLDDGRQDLLLRAALRQHRIGEALANLLPTHPQYAALRNALAKTPPDETDKINRIRLNLDRWRWLPRDLGEKYIIVNVPAYTAALVQNGVTTSRHRAVAGAKRTPTPQISATATGVILNPWWFVPKSIEDEVRGKRGYVANRNADGDVIGWKQPPGPSNALGRIKFVMPNPEAIYLHDTNARGLFDETARAYSHGCIRTEYIMLLAKKLLTESPDSEWTEEKIDAALASGKSVQASFDEPLPVYIVYFSSAALTDGGLIAYEDIYNRDDEVLAALLDTGKSPAKPKEAKKEVASR